ncbi:MAG: hypothetical protein SW833_10050 [Cyanobacteriota bacterium]|nr:hypothetical protein [Cyanobacteriota bacterium]
MKTKKTIDKYYKVGRGAWTSKAIYDMTVTALMNNDFRDLEEFLSIFDRICDNFGGEAASRKLKKAAYLVDIYGNKKELAQRCVELSEKILHKPLVGSCISLEKVQKVYNARQIISSRINEICDFLKCTQARLEISIQKIIESDVVPKNWALQIPSLYEKAYIEWFSDVVENYLIGYLPRRCLPYRSPCVKVVDWSSEVWRCWRLLERPTLVDPGIFRPSQFFVWHIVHDSVHIWQMQAYGKKWSNILSPNEFLFLEAQAMCIERKILGLMKHSMIEVPSWYPSSSKSVILRLLIGLLEREIRLDLDLKVHLQGQSFSSWLKDISKMTSLSPDYFQGLTAELLGMPGFCAAYTVVTDIFQNLPSSQRQFLLEY